MRRTTALDDIKLFFSRCREIDSIWILNIYNEEIKQAEDVLQVDIDVLNRINKLSDIKKEIIAELQHIDDRDIHHFLLCLEEYQAHISMPKINLKDIENNQRFILFANTIMQKNLRNRKLENIINPVYRFFYMIFTYDEYSNNPRALERISERFSNVYLKFNNHFRFANDEFYTWANSYIHENEEYRRLRMTLLDSTDFKINVNSIFDYLYDLDSNIHFALRKKLSNAWYQKKHREDKKVKKPGFYALTVKAKEALTILARKNNLSDEKTLEQLINKAYIKQCKSPSGELLY